MDRDDLSTTRLRAIFLHSVGTLPFLGRPAKTGRAEARKREGEGKGGREEERDPTDGEI